MSKTVFITGCSGFVGRHLSDRLVKDGYDVHGLVRHVSDRMDMFDGINVHFGDIRDGKTIADILDEVQPNIIMHLAYQSSVEYSFTHEEECFDVNLYGSNMLASSARKHCKNLEKYIFASSVETYGNQTEFPITEDNVVNPASPYGVAKVSNEIYLRYLYRGFGFPVVTLRSTNTYGRKFRKYNFVIEHILADMMMGKRYINMGYPQPVRDFLYVDDEVEAYLALIRSTDKVIGGVFNTGTKRGITISELFKVCEGAVRCVEGNWFEPMWDTNSPRGYEISNLTISGDKLTEWTGWKPKVTLEEGIKKTIELNGGSLCV